MGQSMVFDPTSPLLLPNMAILMECSDFRVQLPERLTSLQVEWSSSRLQWRERMALREQSMWVLHMNVYILSKTSLQNPFGDWFILCRFWAGNEMEALCWYTVLVNSGWRCLWQKVTELEAMNITEAGYLGGKLLKTVTNATHCGGKQLKLCAWRTRYIMAETVANATDFGGKQLEAVRVTDVAHYGGKKELEVVTDCRLFQKQLSFFS